MMKQIHAKATSPYRIVQPQQIESMKMEEEPLEMNNYPFLS